MKGFLSTGPIPSSLYETGSDKVCNRLHHTVSFLAPPELRAALPSHLSPACRCGVWAGSRWTAPGAGPVAGAGDGRGGAAS